MRPFRFFDRYRREEDGATAIEYGLLAAMLALALVGIMGTGGAVDALYEGLLAIADALSGSEADSD